MANIVTTPIVSLVGAYRTIHEGYGRGAAAVNGTKYALNPAVTDSGPPGLAASTGGTVLIQLTAADYAATGTSTFLRLTVIETQAAVPNATITITVGLYPVTVSGTSYSLGTVVSGSTVAFVNLLANTITSQNSGDFAFPADGMYCVGFVVSATMSNGANFHAQLQMRNV